MLQELGILSIVFRKGFFEKVVWRKGLKEVKVFSLVDVCGEVLQVKGIVCVKSLGQESIWV